MADNRHKRAVIDVVDGHTCTSRNVYRHVVGGRVNVCLDMCADMCVNMCMYKCVDKCASMWATMCAAIYLDKRCMQMCSRLIAWLQDYSKHWTLGGYIIIVVVFSVAKKLMMKGLSVMLSRLVKKLRINDEIQTSNVHKQTGVRAQQYTECVCKLGHGHMNDHMCNLMHGHMNVHVQEYGNVHGRMWTETCPSD